MQARDSIADPEVVLDALNEAAAEVGVRLNNPRIEGRRVLFRLATKGKPVTVYGRRGHNGRRVPGAVCWHGHRDFMRALYQRLPDVVLRTALAVYNGADDFEDKYLDTYPSHSHYGSWNGSSWAPNGNLSQCDCKEGAV